MKQYLDAVEKRFGTETRNNTQLTHRGGTKFVLKRHDAKHPQLVDMGNLALMARHLQTSI